MTISKTILRTLKLKLVVDKIQEQELLDIIHEYTNVYNDLIVKIINSETKDRFSAHRLFYDSIKNDSKLKSQHIINVISQSMETVKSWSTWCKKRSKICKVPESKQISPRFDQRNFSFTKDNLLSISTLKSRMKLSFHARRDFVLPKGYKLCSGNLVYDRKHNKFYFHVAMSFCASLPDQHKEILACDLGVANLVASYSTSDASFKVFHDDRLLKVDNKFKEIRRSLQSKGTRSASRRLKSIGKKQSRFRRDVNHVVSKNIVDYAVSNNIDTVVLEDLTNIKLHVINKFSKSKDLNFKLSNWSYRQLQTFIDYKANGASIHCVYVDPKYTSVICPICCNQDKSSRISRDMFCCTQCNYSLMSDYVGAYNIARRFFQIV